VLIVEDEALVAFQLEDMLADLGCAIIGPASRVGQALDLLRRRPVDAAVLDLNIGGELVYPVADALACRGLLTFSLPAMAPPALAPRIAAGPSCRSPSCKATFARPCWRA
jgi:DNA-binding NarL/FixJ family response regulator